VQGNQFNIGDCVRLSEPARKNSRRPDRRGRIVGSSPTGSQWRVLWTGLKLPQVLHWIRAPETTSSNGSSAATTLVATLKPGGRPTGTQRA
jgi:hypothetical protein